MLSRWFVGCVFGRLQLADETMSTERCVSLIMKGLYHDIPDMWISRQPYLLLTYVTQYFPLVSRTLFKYLFGPVRVYAFRSGRGIFDITVSPSFCHFCFFMVLCLSNSSISSRSLFHSLLVAHRCRSFLNIWSWNCFHLLKLPLTLCSFELAEVA
jgi:hypothetical protein